MKKKIQLYFKKRKRARNIQRIRNKIPPYLKKSFVEELNYKLWITKGARFNANTRCKRLSHLSNRTIGYLSAYLIIINIVNVFEIPFYEKLPSNYLAFITTALSILILAFSQFEALKNYQLDAERHHQCALEILELYDLLRFYKSAPGGISHQQVNEVREKYKMVLKKYDNHEHWDLDRFQVSKSSYFGLTWLKCIWIRFKYWFQTSLKYHALIVSPVFLFVYYIINTPNK